MKFYLPFNAGMEKQQEPITDNESAKDKTGFVTTDELLKKIPISRRTLTNWRHRKLIPYIKLPGTRRVLFDFESVRAALLRMESN